MPSVLECLPKGNSVSCPSIPIRESPLPESFLACPFKQVPRFHTFPTRNACYIQSGRNIQMHRSTPSTEDLRRGFQPLADHGFVFSNHMLGSTHVNDASTTPHARPAELGFVFSNYLFRSQHARTMRQRRHPSSDHTGFVFSKPRIRLTRSPARCVNRPRRTRVRFASADISALRPDFVP